jgi:hypothetical protein
VLAVGVISIEVLVPVLVLAPIDDATGFELADEGGLLTAVSSALLALACAAAASTSVALRRRGERPWFWLFTTGVLAFLALDEILQFHERMGGWLKASRLGAVPFFRNWNDVVVILYGVAACAVLFAFLPELLRFPRVAALCTVGLGFFAVHTVIDASSPNPSGANMLFEEGCKVLAVGFLATAMYAARRGAGQGGSS